MSKDFSYLRHWITGEGYGPDTPSRPVILECIPSRSGMSMAVYDRGERIFTVPSPACGGGVHKALDRFLEACFVSELSAIHPTWPPSSKERGYDLYGRGPKVGSEDFESAAKVAEAIHLKVTRSESKAGTLIIIQKVTR